MEQIRTHIHLLKQWKTGFNNENREPVLYLELGDGTTVTVQMPGISAKQLGASLIQEAEKAAHAAGRPN